MARRIRSRMNNPALAITMFLVTAGCRAGAGSAPPTPEPAPTVRPYPGYNPEMRRLRDSLERSDVAAQVTEALRRDDHRLLGVQGYGLILPGIPVEHYHSLKDRLGVRILPHTSDMVYAGDHDAYNQAAGSYAYRYNCELLRRLAAGDASTRLSVNVRCVTSLS